VSITTSVLAGTAKRVGAGRFIAGIVSSNARV
jgi:hypothetical protein